MSKNNFEDLEDIIFEIERLEKENKQLREALRMCSPFKAGYCKFCMVDILTETHTEDCEYIKLTEDE